MSYFNDEETTPFVRLSDVNHVHNVRVISLQHTQPVVDLHDDQGKNTVSLVIIKVVRKIHVQQPRVLHISV